jgi:Recombination endonuclease VII
MLETQECITCNIRKPLEDFYKHPTLANKRRGECKECWKKRNQKYYNENREEVLEKTAKWVKEHPERMKIVYAEKRWRDSGILIGSNILTYPVAENIMKFKGYCCWLCERLQDNNGCIDHNHNTHQVRGYLCHHCNSIIIPRIELLIELDYEYVKNKIGLEKFLLKCGISTILGEGENKFEYLDKCIKYVNGVLNEDMFKEKPNLTQHHLEI